MNKYTHRLMCWHNTGMHDAMFEKSEPIATWWNLMAYRAGYERIERVRRRGKIHASRGGISL